MYLTPRTGVFCSLAEYDCCLICEFIYLSGMQGVDLGPTQRYSVRCVHFQAFSLSQKGASANPNVQPGIQNQTPQTSAALHKHCTGLQMYRLYMWIKEETCVIITPAGPANWPAVNPNHQQLAQWWQHSSSRQRQQQCRAPHDPVVCLSCA